MSECLGRSVMKTSFCEEGPRGVSDCARCEQCVCSGAMKTSFSIIRVLQVGGGMLQYSAIRKHGIFCANRRGGLAALAMLGQHHRRLGMLP